MKPTYLLCAAAISGGSAGAMKGGLDSRVSGSCPSLDSFCNSDRNGNRACIRDWATASQASSWCARSDGGLRSTDFSEVYIHDGCSGFNIVVLGQTDTSTFYVYDVTTGQLMGIGANPSWRCLAGTLPVSTLSFACGDGPSVPVCGP